MSVIAKCRCCVATDAAVHLWLWIQSVKGKCDQIHCCKHMSIPVIRTNSTSDSGNNWLQPRQLPLASEWSRGAQQWAPVTVVMETKAMTAESNSGTSVFSWRCNTNSVCESVTAGGGAKLWHHFRRDPLFFQYENTRLGVALELWGGETEF